MASFNHQLIHKINNIFPGFTPDFSANTAHLSELIEKIVAKLPPPTNYEIPAVLTNMRNIVDHQELQIQKNMMEEENQIEHESDSELQYNHQENKSDHGSISHATANDFWGNQDLMYTEKQYLSFLN